MPSLTAPLLAHVRARRELDTYSPSMRRAIRTSAHATLANVGASMDPPVSRSTVHHWETGSRVPREPHLQQYLDLLRALQGDLGGQAAEVSA